jgi:hypothetical protein
MFIDDLTRRAYAAHFRRGDDVEQPSSSLSGVESQHGREYIVLRNVNRVLAVYAVTRQRRVRRV